jgi:hypothetical protein
MFGFVANSSHNIVHVIRRLVGDIKQSMFGEYGNINNIKHMDFIGWRYPPIGWVEINVDGCSKGTQEWLVVLVES